MLQNHKHLGISVHEFGVWVLLCIVVYWVYFDLGFTLNVQRPIIKVLILELGFRRKRFVEKWDLGMGFIRVQSSIWTRSGWLIRIFFSWGRRLEKELMLRFMRGSKLTLAFCLNLDFWKLNIYNFERSRNGRNKRSDKKIVAYHLFVFWTLKVSCAVISWTIRYM